jgi:hypothetical protein
MEANPLRVRSLLGRRHVEMALACLGSLLRYSADPLRLVLHDDGTLSTEDRERLGAELGEAQVLSASETEPAVMAVLAGRPNSRAFREINPLARKLLDIPLLEDGEALAYCDSDILFRRPFRQLYHFREDAVGAVFQGDDQDAYSFRSWQLAFNRSLSLPRFVNSGIIHFRKRHYDPDLVEWFLGRRVLHRTPAWVEQTAWALLGGRAGCDLVDREQIRIASPRREHAGDPVALHFTSPVRAGLASALAEAADRRGESVAAIRSTAAPRCGSWLLLAGELRRRLGAAAGR